MNLICLPQKSTTEPKKTTNETSAQGIRFQIHNAFMKNGKVYTIREREFREMEPITEMEASCVALGDSLLGPLESIFN